MGIGRNPVTGVTHNSGRGLNVGASSVGAGVAAAAGFWPLHLGLTPVPDLRMPAHFCGARLRPQVDLYGRVPQCSGLEQRLRDSHRSDDLHRRRRAPCSRSWPVHHLSTTLVAARRRWLILAELEALMKGKRIAFSPDLDMPGRSRRGRSGADVAGVLSRDLGARAWRRPLPAWGRFGPELGCFFWRSCGALGRAAEMEDRMLAATSPYVSGEGAGLSGGGLHKHARAGNTPMWRRCTTFEEWDYLVTPVASVAHLSNGCSPPIGRTTRGTGWRGRNSCTCSTCRPAGRERPLRLHPCRTSSWPDRRKAVRSIWACSVCRCLPAAMLLLYAVPVLPTEPSACW